MKRLQKIKFVFLMLCVLGLSLSVNVSAVPSHLLSYSTLGQQIQINQIEYPEPLAISSKAIFTDRLEIVDSRPIDSLQNRSGFTAQSLDRDPQLYNLIQKGREFYDRGSYEDAILIWHQASELYTPQEIFLYQPTLLTYISLAYQELGQWEDAERAIATCLDLLQEWNGDAQQKQFLAQALTAKGHLELSIGQLEAALTTWQESTELYRDLNDQLGFTGSLINQALALEALGYYRRACTTLLTAAAVEESCQENVLQNLESLLVRFESDAQPDLRIKILGLRNLGNILRLMGYLPQSKQLLEQALSITNGVDSESLKLDTLMSLANTEQALYHQAKDRYEQTQLDGDREYVLTTAQQALHHYQEVITRSEIRPTFQMLHIQAQLRNVDLLIEFRNWLQANNGAMSGLSLGEVQLDIETQIQDLLASYRLGLPPSRATSYIHLDLAQRLSEVSVEWTPTATQIAEMAAEQAAELQDQRAQSYALGTLGTLYEHLGVQPETLLKAQQITEQALGLAQAIQAWDIAYQWQWQLGRIYVLQEKRELAISYYEAAVETLDGVRKNLLATETDLQFSFRDTVEPVYREFVTLLLQGEQNVEPSQTELRQAVQSIDALQLSELENFLRCDLASSISIDDVQIDPSAAVLYTMLLDAQLAVVLKLPQSEQLHLHTLSISRKDAQAEISALKSQLTRPYISPRSLALSQEVYDWLVRPIESDLAANQVDTLVFVLDGALRSVPMAALHDGENYLIEKYAVALSPGLQLLQPYPLKHLSLNVLTFALSETRQEFSAHSGFQPLENVEAEVQTIQNSVSGHTLLNEAFTSTAMQEWIRSSSDPIVHLATHGQFSSDPEETFVLAWDERINIHELSAILQSRRLGNPHPIELLILSACKTADGDRRATLGLAGVAVQSGARSTVASLWSINDESTAKLMGFFYQELIHAEPQIGKAEALQRAQVKLLHSSGYQAPLFWAPYVLVGNWL